MDFYSLGRGDAAATFFKNAGYTDLENKLLDRWEKASPTRLDPGAHSLLKSYGGAMGGGLGSLAGSLIGDMTDPTLHTMSHPPAAEKDISTRAMTKHDGRPAAPKTKAPAGARPGDKLKLSPGARSAIGYYGGAAAGSVAGRFGIPALTTHIKRQAVRSERRATTRLGLGLSATATAAALAHHFLSKVDEPTKEADYADSMADVWGKVAPMKTPLAAKILGGISGGAAGVGAGAPLGALAGVRAVRGVEGSAPWIPGVILGGGAGGVLGGAAGAVGGVKATDAAVQALVKNRRAAGIRRVAPKAALALGATATAAALAHHFLSRNDE